MLAINFINKIGSESGEANITRINKLVMHGFKSFAKHTELLFGPTFNVVLGPNGSGKSNVMDALCFVLGKTSAKSLRAEKSANLIYNGGKSKTPAKQGEVSIYFNNTDKTFPTEEAEVKISRIVRQNGQSIYKINDQTRTREQVLDLLNISKIDPDGYNIILQGDIVRFVEMPPIDRRLMIEDIAGISIYEDKKHKALLEMEKVEKKLNDAEIVLSERKTYLQGLEKDRDQALKFKNMNEKISMYKASLLKMHIGKKENEKKDLADKLLHAQDEFRKITEKIQKLRADSDQRKKEVESLIKEIEEKGEVEQVNLNKEVEALKIELTRKNYRLETITNEITKIGKRKDELTKALKDVHQRIGEISEEKEKLSKRQSGSEKEQQALGQKIAAFRKKNNMDNISDIDKQVEDIDKRGEELQKDIHTLREQQHAAIRENDALQHQISTIESQIQKVAEVEKEHQKEVAELKRKREQFKKATLELNKRLNDDSLFAAMIGAEQERIAKLREQLIALEARDATIKEASLGDIAVKKILSLNKAGIYGTVAELGNVNAKYALALEIAAGSRIKSIVVENDQIAADCIKYLKQNKLGIATFLPLSKIKPNVDASAKELKDAHGCLGMALDLVEYDTKFKKVFEYVFSNTLVVETIDVARRIGIGKAKMVTLEGDVAELSGVMQGGFREKKRKGLGFKEKELSKDINQYREQMAQLEEGVSQMQKERKDNEERITALRQEKGSLEGEIIKTEKSLHLEPTDLDLSKNQKEELIKKQKEIEGQTNELITHISKLNKELAQLKTDKQKLRFQIVQLRDPGLLAEISTFEEKLRKISEERIQANADIKNIEAQVITIHKPEELRVHEILREITKEEAEFNKERAELGSYIQTRQKLLNEKEEQAKIFYSKFKALFAQQGKLNEEIQKNESGINQHKDTSTQIEIKTNTLTLKISEAQELFSSLQQEFQQYEGIALDMEKNEDQLKYEISKFEKLKQEIGFVNMRSLEIYDEVEKEYNGLLEKKETLTVERADVVKLMEEIEGKKKELFLRHFEIINEHFKRAFVALSSKGDAFLELEDPDSIFEAGVRIKVKITGTKFLDIRSLSGGEKTMTALAFIFAIQEHEPATFYILDEVDAALDKHNSEKFAKLIAKYSEKAQYLIISHNDGVISQAENLYGISMNEHGISNVVSLKI